VADIPFTFPNGVRGTLSEDGKIAMLGKAAAPDQKPSALSGPGATDPDAPSPMDYGKDVLGRQRTQPVKTPGVGRPADPMEVDPIAQGVVGGVLGAGAGALAGGLVPAVAGPVVGGAVNGATQTAVQGGTPGEIAAGAGIGGLAGGAGQVAHAIGNAPAAAAERVAAARPTQVTGGARSKVAKAVVNNPEALDEISAAHPDLAKTLYSGADPAAKAEAVDTKLGELTSANDAVHDQIAKQHPSAVDGRIPLEPTERKLQALANKAHDAGNSKLRDAANTAIAGLKDFADSGGRISPSQLRGVRNTLAENISGAAPPGSALATAATRNAGAVKATLNEAIADLADETPGVDAAALKTRNRHIAALIPVQQSLEEQAGSAALKPPSNPISRLARAIGKPAETVAHYAERAPSVIDQHLAKLAGPSGPAGVAALKAVALQPSAATLRAAVQAGVTPQVALQVARLGAGQMQPAGAQ
jgi:hypothetical protein